MVFYSICWDQSKNDDYNCHKVKNTSSVYESPLISTL